MAAPTLIDLPNDIFTVIGRFVSLKTLRLTCQRFVFLYRRYHIIAKDHPPRSQIRLPPFSTLTFTIWPGNGYDDFYPNVWMSWLAKHFTPDTNHHLVVYAEQGYNPSRNRFRLDLLVPKYRPASITTYVPLVYIIQFMLLPETITCSPSTLFFEQSAIHAKKLYLTLGITTENMSGSIIADELYVRTSTFNCMLLNKIHTSARIIVQVDDPFSFQYLRRYFEYSTLRSITFEVHGDARLLFINQLVGFTISNIGNVYTIEYKCWRV